MSGHLKWKSSEEVFFMGSRNITLKEDVYEMLVRDKAKDESFSDVIRRVVKTYQQ